MSFRWFVAALIFVVGVVAAIDVPVETFMRTANATMSLDVDANRNDGFWVRVELAAVAWRRNCVIKTLCAEPRLAVAHARQHVDERVSADWRADRTFAMETPLVSRSFWPDGSPSDVSVQVSVSGVDSIFHFARLCDETPHVRVAPRDRPWTEKDELLPTVVDLRANCFNATLHVRIFRAGECAGEAPKQSDSTKEGNQPASLLALPTGRLTTEALIVVFSALTAFNVLALFFTLFYCTRAGLRCSETAPQSATDSASTFLPYDGHQRAERLPYANSELYYDTIGDLSVRKSFLRFPDPEPSADERDSRPPSAPAAPPSWHRHSHSHADMYRMRLPYPAPSPQPPFVTPRRATRSMVSISRVRLPVAQCCDDCFLRGMRPRANGLRPAPCSCAFSPSTTSSRTILGDSGRDSIV